jgi:Resolvase, N terminal domain
MKYGYARVSTDDQDLTVQREALAAAGCTVIREEKPSGALACYKLDRIGRSLAHLTKLLADLEAGCWFLQPGGSVDFTRSSAGVSGEISRHSAVGVPAPGRPCMSS